MIKRFLKNQLPNIVDWAPHGLLSRMLGGFTPIFMLHRIAVAEGGEGHTPSFIKQCLAYVRKHGYNPISLADYAGLVASAEPVPPKSVVFTIDDGFKEQCVAGGDIFGKYDVPLTCFVITDFIDGHLWPWDDQVNYVLRNASRRCFTVTLMDGSDWQVDLDAEPARDAVHRLRDRLKAIDQTGMYPWLADLYTAAGLDVVVAPPGDCQPASWADLNTFVARGHSVAAHTRTHRILSRLGDDESRREILGSIQYLQQQVPGASAVFAYPTGRSDDFGEREMAVMQEAGHDCAVSTLAGAATPRCHRYILPRFPMPLDFVYFVRYLTYLEVIRERLRRGA